MKSATLGGMREVEWVGGCWSWVGERLGERLRMGGEWVLKHWKDDAVLSQLRGDTSSSYWCR